MKTKQHPAAFSGVPGVALLALSAVACSSAPLSYYGVAPPGRETAYQCAVAQLNIMGYTIEDGSEDVGFIRGRKQTSGLSAQIFTGNTYHDVLTATAFDNPATDETTLRVVATRIADKDAALGFGIGDGAEQGEGVLAPSDSGKSDAQALLANCGVTSVVGPSAGQDGHAFEGMAAEEGTLLRVDRGRAGDR